MSYLTVAVAAAVGMSVSVSDLLPPLGNTRLLSSSSSSAMSSMVALDGELGVTGVGGRGLTGVEG